MASNIVNSAANTIMAVPSTLMPSMITSTTPAWISVCGNVAPFAALAVFLAPFPTIQQIASDKSVGSLPLLPYSSMIANCMLWLTYGILKQDIKVWSTNAIGLLFALFYFARFAKFSPGASPTLPGSIRQHVQVNAVIGIVVMLLTKLLPSMDAASIIGNAAVLFCIAMFGSPLATLQRVVQTRSAESIPLPFTLATITNCFLWSVYGLGKMKDVNIYLPNLLGLAFGLVQVGLKAVLRDGMDAAVALAGTEREERLLT